MSNVIEIPQPGAPDKLSYEQWLGALCLWREARSEGMEAMLAVWFVIHNRMSDSEHRWPKTVSGVLLQAEQFDSLVIKGDPETVAWPRQPIPPASPSADWLAWVDAQTIVETAFSGQVLTVQMDPSKGANMYESLPEGAKRPAWATPEALTATIGAIRFYRI